MSKSLPIHTAYQSLLTKGRLTTNPGQASLVARLATLQHNLTTGPNSNSYGSSSNATPHSNGVYIYGDVGTGKSRIADLFAATLPDTITRRRVHFHEFMMDVHVRLHQARSRPNYTGDPLLRIGREIHQESRVLCFDEFQVNDIADAMILMRLFGAIWDAGGVMVSTSNRHPTRLYENGLNRPLFVPFIRELERRCEVWEMQGKADYRMSSVQPKDAEEMCFFSEREGFERSLEKALGGSELESVALPVMMSRELVVQASRRPSKNQSRNQDGKAIVHATFPGLCEKTLGTADYHALCKFAHTIYLSGLRQFASDELDFVRRFINLIDIAYESRTRIVCLSTVPLFEVFKNIVVPTPTTEIKVSKDTDSKQDQQNKAYEKLGEKLLDRNLSVKKGGGSSSSMMSTFIGEVEWSATGLREASLASGGAGETDVRFAVGRAVSRLFEMNSLQYGITDD